MWFMPENESPKSKQHENAVLIKRACVHMSQKKASRRHFIAAWLEYPNVPASTLLICRFVYYSFSVQKMRQPFCAKTCQTAARAAAAASAAASAAACTHLLLLPPRTPPRRLHAINRAASALGSCLPRKFR
jgi:hypothetical protein